MDRGNDFVEISFSKHLHIASSKFGSYTQLIRTMNTSTIHQFSFHLEPGAPAAVRSPPRPGGAAYLCIIFCVGDCMRGSGSGYKAATA